MNPGGRGPGADRRDKGGAGEEAAARYLAEKGYEIVERNFHGKNGEIDIVARKGEYLCFVEVRSKTTGDYADPIESVTVGKQRKILKAALEFLAARGLDANRYAVRFDVVGVIAQGGPPAITHIENAFEGAV